MSMFVVLGACWDRFLNVLGACKAHFRGLGSFVWLLGVQDMSKGPPWKHFGMFWCSFGRHLGSHLGVVLVLCCNFLEIFLGSQIHSHSEGVSEAILSDLATSWNVKTIENAREGLKKYTFHTISLQHAFGCILDQFWKHFGSHVGATLQLFGVFFGMPNSSLFRKRFVGDFK